MARVLHTHEVTFYRALVTRQRANGTSSTYAYGPYTVPNQCRDRDAGWYARESTGTKVEVQRLEPVITDLPDEIIVNLGWVTIRTRVSDGWTE
jgi:hypothetical protein